MKTLLAAVAAVPLLAACSHMDGTMKTNTEAVAPPKLTAEQKTEAASKLNEITGMLLDSQKIYGDAAKLAKDPEYKAQLASLSNDRAEEAANFQAHVRNIGGEPVTSGGPGGAWQSSMMNLASLGQNDTKAAVGQVLKAENGLVEKLDDTLSDAKLADSTKEFLKGARDHIAADRDHVADLKSKIDARVKKKKNS